MSALTLSAIALQFIAVLLSYPQSLPSYIVDTWANENANLLQPCLAVLGMCSAMSDFFGDLACLPLRTSRGRFVLPLASKWEG